MSNVPMTSEEIIKAVHSCENAEQLAGLFSTQNFAEQHPDKVNIWLHAAWAFYNSRYPKVKFPEIRQWARDRNLIEGSNPTAQIEKFFEECGELVRSMLEEDEIKFKDAVGDVIVVLTIMCCQLDIDIEDCIAGAYNEIKDRKGKMVNGVFVKEAV